MYFAGCQCHEINPHSHVQCYIYLRWFLWLYSVQLSSSSKSMVYVLSISWNPSYRYPSDISQMLYLCLFHLHDVPIMPFHLSLELYQNEFPFFSNLMSLLFPHIINVTHLSFLYLKKDLIISSYTTTPLLYTHCTETVPYENTRVLLNLPYPCIRHTEYPSYNCII